MFWSTEDAAGDAPRSDATSANRTKRIEKIDQKVTLQPAMKPTGLDFQKSLPAPSAVADLDLKKLGAEQLGVTDSVGSLATDGLVSERNPPESLRARSSPPLSIPVHAQISEAIRAAKGSAIEVNLAPEELGKLRISMSLTDLGMTVYVTAERQETLDLLKRNIDLLAQDLSENGFETLRFEFADHPGSGDTENSDAPLASAVPEDPSLEDAIPPPVAALKVGNGNLDIRI